MTPLLIITVITALPVLLALFLGVNSVFLFLSVSVGMLLQAHLADSVSLTLSSFFNSGPLDIIASVSLLSLPVLLTLIILRRSAKPSVLVLQLAPLVFTGLVFGYAVLGQLSGSFQDQVYASQVGSSIKQASDVVPGVAGVLNLLLAWSLYRHKRDPKHGKHH